MKYPIDQWSTVGKAIDNSVVFTSKNLRGLVRYTERAKAVRIIYWRDERNSWNGRLRVIYADGVVSEAHFESFDHMWGWIESRRIFKGVERVYL